MKQPKRLTRKQKIAVYAAGYFPDNWMLVAETEFYLKIIHKIADVRRTVDRYAIPRKKGGKKLNDINKLNDLSIENLANKSNGMGLWIESGRITGLMDEENGKLYKESLPPTANQSRDR